MVRVTTVLVIVLFVVVVGYVVRKRSYYSHDHPILDKVRAGFKKLSPQYAKIPLRIGSSSYTENKSAITLCIVDPKTGNYYGDSTIMYVALHELSHVLCHSHNHTDEFNDIFGRLLKRAIKIGIYNPREPMPENYCGMT